MTRPATNPDAPLATPVEPPALVGSPAVPDDVRKFAEENGVAKYLPGLLELMARILPGRPITIQLDWDPSIPDDGYITFRADTADLSGGEWLAAYDAWRNGVRALCANDDTHFFHYGA
jgi:hypothetical protein